MKSVVLDTLGCSYLIQPVPADGNCFYHAFIKAYRLNVTVAELRRFVSKNITNDDAVVFGALHNKQMRKKQVRDIVRNTNQWADEVEISVLTRSLPNVALFIVDEDNQCVCKRGQDGAKYKSTIALKDEHYYAIVTNNAELSRIMSGLEYLYVDLNEKANEPVIESVTEPVIASLTEPVVESATEPVIESVTNNKTHFLISVSSLLIAVFAGLLIASERTAYNSTSKPPAPP